MLSGRFGQRLQRLLRLLRKQNKLVKRGLDLWKCISID